jgi:hypothetical protein
MTAEGSVINRTVFIKLPFTTTQSDYNDTIFCNSTENGQLPHYRDNYDANGGYFYVKIGGTGENANDPELPYNQNVTIYVYYGNSTIYDTSLVNDTFINYTSFNTGSNVPPTGWRATSGTAVWNNISYAFEGTTSANGRGAEVDLEFFHFPRKNFMAFEVWKYSLSYAQKTAALIVSQSNFNNGIGSFSATCTGNNQFFFYKGASDVLICGGAANTSQWYLTQLKIDFNGTYNKSSATFFNTGHSIVGTLNNSDWFGQGTGGNQRLTFVSGVDFFDAFRIYNSSYAEPSYEIKGEQSPAVEDTTKPTVTISSPTNTTYAYDTVWTNVTLNETGSWCGVNNDTNSVNLTMTNSTGNWNYAFNITNGLLSKGGHFITFYCNDTSGNMNDSVLNNVTFTIDNTLPAYSLNSTNSTTAGASIDHSLNWTDDVGLSGYIFSWNNSGVWTNDTWIAFGANTWSNITNTSNATAGLLIQWCVYANDTSSNWNGTSCVDKFNYTTISGDTTSPIITVQSPVNNTLYPNNTIWFNVTLNEAGSICLVNISDTNQTLTNSTGNWNYLNNTLSSGNYQTRFYCNDTSGNMNSSIVMNFTIDINSPTYSLNSTNSTLAETAIDHDLFWNDNIGLSYYIFSWNSSGRWDNATPTSFNGGTWSNITNTSNTTTGLLIQWCFYANDTSNNWNSSCVDPFSYTTTSATASWWNDSFGKCSNINLDIPSGETPKGFQMYINVTYDSDMEEYFNDLRFVNSSCNNGGSALPYWIENNVSSNFADVWIRVDNNITTFGYIISMYYDNSTPITTSSNGFTTWDFFDDFCDGTYTDKWQTRIVSGSITEENCHIFLNAPASSAVWLFNHSNDVDTNSKLITNMAYNFKTFQGVFIKNGTKLIGADSFWLGIGMLSNSSASWNPTLRNTLEVLNISSSVTQTSVYYRSILSYWDTTQRLSWNITSLGNEVSISEPNRSSNWFGAYANGQPAYVNLSYFAMGKNYLPNPTYDIGSETFLGNLNYIELTLTSPVNTTYIFTSSYNISINGTTNYDANISFSINNTVNVTACNLCTSFQNYTYLDNGIHNITVYAMNSTNSSDVSFTFVNFTVNYTQLPHIQIILNVTSPTNTTYTIYSLPYNVSISGNTNITANITYSINLTSNQTACNNCTSFQNYTLLGNGIQNITVYAVDYTNASNINISFIKFTIDYHSPNLQWWNLSFGKCRNIVITENSNNDLIDYQTFVNLTYDSDMNSGFSDMMFINTSCNNGGIPLSHWLEEKKNSQWAAFWVKVDKISSSAIRTISVYYNNPSENSGSNGDNTFLFFDDFKDNTYAGKWKFTNESEPGTCTYVEENGHGSLSCTVNSASFLNLTSESGGLSAIANISISTSCDSLGIWMRNTSNITGAYGYCLFGGLSNNTHGFYPTIRNSSNDKWNWTTSFTTVVNRYYRARLAKWDNKSLFEVRNGTVYGSVYSIENGINGTGFGFMSNGCPARLNITYYALSKYTFPEPSISISDEHTPSESTYISLNVLSPTNTTYNTNDLLYNISINGTTNYNANVTYSINGTANQTACNVCTSFQNYTLIGNGINNITVYAMNFTNSSDIYFVFVNFTVNYTQPPYIHISLNLISPTNTTYIPSPYNISISGTTNYDANITFSLNETTNQTACNNCTSFQNYTYLGDDIHNITVYATNFTNSSDVSFVFVEFTITTPPPSPSLGITITSPANLTSSVINTAFVLNGTITCRNTTCGHVYAYPEVKILKQPSDTTHPDIELLKLTETDKNIDPIVVIRLHNGTFFMPYSINRGTEVVSNTVMYYRMADEISGLITADDHLLYSNSSWTNVGVRPMEFYNNSDWIIALSFTILPGTTHTYPYMMYYNESNDSWSSNVSITPICSEMNVNTQESAYGATQFVFLSNGKLVLPYFLEPSPYKPAWMAELNGRLDNVINWINYTIDSSLASDTEPSILELRNLTSGNYEGSMLSFIRVNSPLRYYLINGNNYGHNWGTPYTFAYPGSPSGYAQPMNFQRLSDDRILMMWLPTGSPKTHNLSFSYDENTTWEDPITFWNNNNATEGGNNMASTPLCTDIYPYDTILCTIAGNWTSYYQNILYGKYIFYNWTDIKTATTERPMFSNATSYDCGEMNLYDNCHPSFGITGTEYKRYVIGIKTNSTTLSNMTDNIIVNITVIPAYTFPTTSTTTTAISSSSSSSTTLVSSTTTTTGGGGATTTISTTTTSSTSTTSTILPCNIEINSLNDSSTVKNITFNGNENHTVYVAIPRYYNVTDAQLSLSGYSTINSSSFIINDTEFSYYITGDPVVSNEANSVDENWDTYSSGLFSETVYENFTVPYNNIGMINWTFKVQQFAEGTRYFDAYCLNISDKTWYNLLHYVGLSSAQNFTLTFINDCINNTLNGIVSTKIYLSSVIGIGGSRHYESLLTFFNNSYPTNPYLDVSNDGDTQWLYSEVFNQSNNRTSDFSSELNDILSSCSCSGCSLSGTNCTIPLTFHSDTPGILGISDINITASLGLFIRTFDENSLQQIYFNYLISNDTYSLHGNNTWILSISCENLPKGETTIIISNSSYVDRYYYLTLNQSTTLNAYLIQTGTGNYITTFVYSNTQPTGISGATTSALRFLNGSWVVIDQKITDAQGKGYFYLYPWANHKVRATYGSAITQIESYYPNPSFILYIQLNNQTISANYTWLFDTLAYSLLPTSTYVSGVTPINFSVVSTAGDLESYSINITKYYHKNYTQLYANEVTGSPLGGVISYNLNVTQYQNSTERFEVVIKIKRAGYAEWNYTKYYIPWQEFSYLPLYMTQLKIGGFGIKSDFGTHIIALFCALAAGGMVSRINVSGYSVGTFGGSVLFIIVLCFFAYFGFFAWEMLLLMGFAAAMINLAVRLY